MTKQVNEFLVRDACLSRRRPFLKDYFYDIG